MEQPARGGLERPAQLSELWHFEPQTLSLSFGEPGRALYRVDLKKITSSACMLDIIFDVCSKPWASKEITGDLIKALQELFDPQITLCGAGRDHQVDPIEILHSRRIH